MAYILTGADREQYPSATPGALGGHRGNRGYGRLDCPAALGAIARGGYVRHRVFFADEPTAVAAGYRPCGRCMPDRYRAWRGGAAWPEAPWRSLRFAGRFDAAQLRAFLAARAIPGVESVDGDHYRRTLDLPHGPALVELDLGEDDRVRMRLPACDSRDRRAAAARVRCLLGLDHDPSEARAALARDPLLAPLIAARPGLRVPGCADGFELLIRAIVHQQVSLAAARTVLGRIVAAHGRRMSKQLDERRFPALLFPTREALAAVDPGALPMPAARGRAIVAAANAPRTGAIEDIPGVGPWTAAYVAMRAGRDPDAFPASDLGIKRALRRLGDPDPERWRPYRALAAHHLWVSTPTGVLPRAGAQA